MQCGPLMSDGSTPEMAAILDAARRQITAARRAGALVVYLQNDGAVGSPDEPGTPGWALALEPALGEVTVRKSDDNGFVGTHLEGLLREHRVEVISVCGVQSEMCVAATARAAMELGFSVVLAHDSHATYAIPAFSPGELDVSAQSAARVAEWSLGDAVVIPPTAADVLFEAPPSPPTHEPAASPTPS